MGEYARLIIDTDKSSSQSFLDDFDNLDIDIPQQSNNSIFTINSLIEKLRVNSIEKNRKQLEESKYISGYDIARECIRKVVYRLTGYPVDIGPDEWLPVSFRAALGNAIHDFIQSNFDFTEVEVTVKVPSIMVSTRIDAIINDNVLVEIKSCQLKDYLEIVRTSAPRKYDLIQTVLYRYLLHNYLDEAKKSDVARRTPPPKLDKYNINLIQIIYVANDIFSSDFESLEETLEYFNNVKKVFNSRDNHFYFISCINLDVKSFVIDKYEEFVSNKIKKINFYIKNNKIPPLTDEFIDKKSCYFCQYKKVCR